MTINFNPHSPCGERPATCVISGSVSLFQSTLPLRGATRQTIDDASTDRISIHTPLAGSDRANDAIHAHDRDFNPHSPCGERPAPKLIHSRSNYFNPHSPCGERLALQFAFRGDLGISIHTPLAGSDSGRISVSMETPKFQSTLPLRGATQRRPRSIPIRQISIHTPLAGSDCMCNHMRLQTQISIHTPLAGSDLPPSYL